MRPAHRFARLLAQTQLSDQGAVTIDVLLLQIGQQVTAAADHLEQSATAVVIVLVGLEMLEMCIRDSSWAGQAFLQWRLHGHSHQKPQRRSARGH